MQYADQQMMSFTLDPTDRVIEFTSTGGGESDETWTMSMIGWAIVSQPSDPGGGARTDLEPVVLQDDQYAVPLSRILATQHAGGVTWRIHHRT